MLIYRNTREHRPEKGPQRPGCRAPHGDESHHEVTISVWGITVDIRPC